MLLRAYRSGDFDVQRVETQIGNIDSKYRGQYLIVSHDLTKVVGVRQNKKQNVEAFLNSPER